MAGSASGGDNNPSSDTTSNSLFQVPLVPNSLARPPILWTSNEVKTWVGFCIQEFSLPPICLDKFNINGKALLILTRADFIERAPEAGDVLYNVFQHLSRNKGGCLTYSFQGCIKGPVFLSPVKDLSPLKESGCRISCHRPTTSFVPILPHPAPSGVGVASKEDNPGSLQDVPASILSPAPTEKYSSDSDSCPNDAGPSPSSVDMAIGHHTKRPDHRQGQTYLNLQTTSHTPLNDHQQASEGRLLWEFIHQLLEDEKYRDVVFWETQSNLVFVIKNPSRLAELWGLQKNRSNMTYEKLSRALRYYYKMKIIQKVHGKKLTYQFLLHPTKIRRGQRGARPQSQRSSTSAGEKAHDTGLMNNAMPGLITESLSSNPSNISKGGSLSSSPPTLSLLNRYSPNGQAAASALPDHPGMESRAKATVSELSTSDSQKEEKPDAILCKQHEKKSWLPSQTLENGYETKNRPLSCPLDHTSHLEKESSSDGIDRRNFTKSLSLPVSPTCPTDIGGYISVMSLSSQPEPYLCHKTVKRETFVRSKSPVKYPEQTAEPTMKSDDNHHGMPYSFINDLNHPPVQVPCFNINIPSHNYNRDNECLTASASKHLYFNIPVQENSNNVYSSDRHSQNSFPSSYIQLNDFGKMLHSKPRTPPAASPAPHNFHRPFMESTVTVSDGLYGSDLHQIDSKHVPYVPFMKQNAIPQVKLLSSKHTSSMLEPHPHLYQPYPVQSRIQIDPHQFDSTNRVMRPVILKSPESRGVSSAHSTNSFQHGSQITQGPGINTCMLDTKIPDNVQCDSNDRPAMMKDSTNMIAQHKNYDIRYNQSTYSLSQYTKDKVEDLSPSINSSLVYVPNCSSGKFEVYENVQEHPEDLSISVKT